MKTGPYSDLDREELVLLLTFPVSPILCTAIALSLLTVQIQSGLITRPHNLQQGFMS